MDMKTDATVNFDGNEVGFIGCIESKQAIVAGSGACRAQDCNCGGFKPTGKGNDVCAYCGHMWGRHW